MLRSLCQVANSLHSGHYDIIYKSFQPYHVHLQQQTMPIIPMRNIYGNSNDEAYNETMSHLFPSSTFSHTTSTDLWSGIAPNSLNFSNRSSDSATSYPPQYNCYDEPSYTSQIPTPPVFVIPQAEISTQAAPPSPPYPTGPATFASHTSQTAGPIRLSQYVKKFETGQHQPVPLETGPFRK